MANLSDASAVTVGDEITGHAATIPLALDKTRYEILEAIVVGGARHSRDIASAARVTAGVSRHALRGLVQVGLVRVAPPGFAPTPMGVAFVRCTRPALHARHSRTRTVLRETVRAAAEMIGQFKRDYGALLRGLELETGIAPAEQALPESEPP